MHCTISYGANESLTLKTLFSLFFQENWTSKRKAGRLLIKEFGQLKFPKIPGRL